MDNEPDDKFMKIEVGGIYRSVHMIWTVERITNHGLVYANTGAGPQCVFTMGEFSDMVLERMDEAEYMQLDFTTMTHEEIGMEIMQDTPINAARKVFRSCAARLEQMGQQARAPSPFEERRLEFLAVQKIARALGIK